MALHLGSGAIAALYLGATEVTKAYLGSTVVLEPAAGGAVDVVDASPTTQQGSGTSINTTYTAGAGSNRMVVIMGVNFNGSGPGTLSATMGGQAFTVEGTIAHVGGFEGMFLAVIREADIPSGSQTVTLTSTTSDSLGFSVFTIENAHQSNAIVYAAAGDNGNVATDDITPTAADSLIVGAATDSSTGASLAWSATLADYGTTLAVNGTQDFLAGQASGLAASAQTCTYTGFVQRYFIQLAAFEPA